MYVESLRQAVLHEQLAAREAEVKALSLRLTDELRLSQASGLPFDCLCVLVGGWVGVIE